MRWIALLMITALLAGCTDSDPPDAPDAPSEPADPDGPTEPGEPGTESNQPPTVRLTSKSANVTVPGNATLQLEGSDPDDDALTWELREGTTVIESGEALPTEVRVAFEAAGDRTFTLEINDGNASAEASLTLQGIAAPELGPDPVHLDLDIAMSCFQCFIIDVGAFPDNCVGLRQGENNQDCAWVAIDDTWRGRDFVTGGPFDVDVSWYESCESGAEIETIGAEGHDTGIIHDTAGCMVMWDWDANPEAGVITLDIA